MGRWWQQRQRGRLSCSSRLSPFDFALGAVDDSGLAKLRGHGETAGEARAGPSTPPPPRVLPHLAIRVDGGRGTSTDGCFALHGFLLSVSHSVRLTVPASQSCAATARRLARRRPFANSTGRNPTAFPAGSQIEKARTYGMYPGSRNPEQRRRSMKLSRVGSLLSVSHSVRLTIRASRSCTAAVRRPARRRPFTDSIRRNPTAFPAGSRSEKARTCGKLPGSRNPEQRRRSM